jgi:preprotein translocase subunit SecA
MNKQREIIYGLRKRVLHSEITDDEILTKLTNQLHNTVDMYAPRGIVESEVLPISTALVEIVPFDDASQTNLSTQFKSLGTAGEIKKLLDQILTQAFSSRKKMIGDDNWKQMVKYAYLSSIDNLWVEHLDAVDDLRSGIGLRGYGQRDPLVEYKGEAFSMFERLVAQIESEFSKRLFRMQIGSPSEASRTGGPQIIEIKPDFALPQEPVSPKLTNSQINESHGNFLSAMQSLQKTAAVNKNKSLGRNDPCPCGSGKKWKKCHYPNIP